MSGELWRPLELAVTRLVSHAGWRSVQDIGQSGDRGADILAVKPNVAGDQTFLFQVKAVSGPSYVGVSAIDQAVRGQAHYGAKVVIVATNGEFTKSAYKRKDQLCAQGFDVRLWNGTVLETLANRMSVRSAAYREPRDYQGRIVDRIINNVDAQVRRSLFVVATGLGKTVIAATAADRLFARSFSRILVLCHAVDLAQQLQREFWPQLAKNIPTRLFMDGQPPVPINGINFGLYQSLFNQLGGVSPDAFDLIIVDEAHHALANAFGSTLEHLRPKHLIAMTATPWRGDGRTVESYFGDPIERLSLVDGMKSGYLAKVDYRLMTDNIDWDEVPRLARKSVSIRDLNRRLFVPQRDEAVVAEIRKVASQIANPRIVVFSPSKAHAASFADMLSAAGIAAANMSVEDKFERRKLLVEFSAGRIRALTAVDVLNEGIDVPDVNLLVFLRATHSRRIFVQQLGRGLRLALGKDKVIVLDFVTDIRRIAAVLEMDNEAKEEPKAGEIERVYLRDGIVQFSNPSSKAFIDQWLEDVASLNDADDAQRLTFPDC
ncbi:DEAD/DEAH box helicase family protein [Devosia sp. Naph2]|uniref:DEAD/DEAH box helicase family protein n=1 Tax=Devosia polycyclovorans TaxID=3345148 RepID=UPI0035CF44F4